ncbi:MAG: redoxin domain-containing protein [Rikenellaceae bacterium]|nr:redoxin domain-containing protein [Rikenellaceae bacterium]
MKRFVFCLLGTLCVAAASARPVRISGHIAGLGSDTLLVMHTPLGGPGLPPDMLLTAGDTFTYTISADEPGSLFITQPRYLRTHASASPYDALKNLYLIFRPGDRIHIEGSIDSVMRTTLTGSPFIESLSAFMNRRLAVTLRLFELQQHGLGDAPDADQQTLDDSLRTIYSVYEAEETDYVRTHPDDPVSVLITANSPDSTIFGTRYALLGDSARSSFLAPMAESARMRYDRNAALQQAARLIVPGQPAPDFALRDSSGTMHSLSAFRGRYVVLNFWGSWCGECIADLPALTACHAKYRDRCTFINIACYSGARERKAALAAHDFPGLNLIDTPATLADDAAIRYGAQHFPVKLLIDPEGTIVRRLSGPSHEFYKMLDSTLGVGHR